MNKPNTPIVLTNVSLRKLTWKSKWDFTEKYQGLTMEEVFKMKPSSLWWLYCKYEKISFMDEILEKLEEKFPLKRIQKPGIDPTQMEYFDNLSFETKSYEELKKMISAKRLNGQSVPLRLVEIFRQKKSERIVTDIKSSMSISKRSLQSINHGKLNKIINV